MAAAAAAAAAATAAVRGQRAAPGSGPLLRLAARAPLPRADLRRRLRPRPAGRAARVRLREAAGAVTAASPACSFRPAAPSGAQRPPARLIAPTRRPAHAVGVRQLSFSHARLSRESRAPPGGAPAAPQRPGMLSRPPARPWCAVGDTSQSTRAGPEPPRRTLPRAAAPPRPASAPAADPAAAAAPPAHSGWQAERGSPSRRARLSDSESTGAALRVDGRGSPSRRA